MENEIKSLSDEIRHLKAAINAIQVSHTRVVKRARRTTNCLAVFAFLGVAGSLHATGTIKPHFVPDLSASSVSLPPLDSFVTWARKDAVSTIANHTTEVLSIVGDGAQANSYLWPLYVELRGTTSPEATMATSQSAGVTVRAIARSLGNPWMTGFHSEIAHGREGIESGAIVPTRATSILFNGEMRSYASGGETIGLNLQCVHTDSLSKNCDHAINIQNASTSTIWRDGIHFDSVDANELEGIAINLDRSRFQLGLDLANNSMRLNAGQKIFLNESGSVFLSYNPETMKVEIVRSGIVAASF